MEPLPFTSASVALLRRRLDHSPDALAGDVAPSNPLPPDEQAFLRAVLADPHDSLPRLVYADWLEERGDPRGEFLRLATRLRDEERLFSRDRPAMRDRLDELRPLLPVNWRTAFDFTRRFYVVWSTRVRDQIARQPHGRPPGALRAVAPPWGYWENPTFTVGDYVYALTLVDGRLLLVSRMRAVRGKRLTRSAVVGHFPWERRSAILGDEGLPIRLGPVVPRAALEQVRFAGRKQQKYRQLRLDRDDRVQNHGALHGAYEMTPESAVLFDALLNGWVTPADWPAALSGAT
jgi:uncharacterized protein (TIGR02996 family)